MKIYDGWYQLPSRAQLTIRWIWQMFWIMNKINENSIDTLYYKCINLLVKQTNQENFKYVLNFVQNN